MRNPSPWLALALAAACAPAAAAPETVPGGPPGRLGRLVDVHHQLEAQLAALRGDAAQVQAGGRAGEDVRAKLGQRLAELPDPLQRYDALEKDLGVDDSVLVRRLQDEIQAARAAAPAGAEQPAFPARVAKIRDDLARLLEDVERRYPQLATEAGRGEPGAGSPGASRRGHFGPAPEGAASRILQCAGAAFDGAHGCGGSAPSAGSGRPADAAPRDPGGARLTTTSHGVLSGGHARLDEAASGVSKAVPAQDSWVPAADKMLAARLRKVAADPRAFNARAYLALYQALAARRDPRALAAWENQARDYLDFKNRRAPNTAVAEACWRALAGGHPDIARGCADKPRTAAVMAGAWQAVKDTAKGLVSPMSLALILGSLLVGGLATGGVADLIALLVTAGFTLWMAWKVIRDYGPKLFGAIRDLARSKSGSVESFQRWQQAAYAFTGTLVAVVGIFLGAKGIASLASRLGSAAARGSLAADASMEASASRGAASAEASSAARGVLEKAAASEPRITADLQRLVHEDGGELVGLENRLKTARSLDEKITGDMQKEGLSPHEAAANIGDAVRYTSVLPEQSFTEGVEATLERLQAKGYRIRKLKNTFRPGSIYKGINSSLVSPDGQIFELQFHTRGSFDLKMAMHVEYETFRSPSASLQARQAAFDKMEAAWSRVAEPRGVERIGQLVPLAARP